METQSVTSFARRLKDERLLLRVSQEKMAALLRVGLSTYVRWELGKTKPSVSGEIVLAGIKVMDTGKVNGKIHPITSQSIAKRTLACLARIADVLEKIEDKL